MSKTSIEQKRPILAFLILQCVNFKMLQLKYNLFSSFCNPNKCELIEMDTDSLYMALCEEQLHEIIRPEMRTLWYWMMQSGCNDNFASNSKSIFFNENVAISMLPLIRKLGLSHEELRCSTMSNHL